VVSDVLSLGCCWLELSITLAVDWDGFETPFGRQIPFVPGSLLDCLAESDDWRGRSCTKLLIASSMALLLSPINVDRVHAFSAAVWYNPSPLLTARVVLSQAAAKNISRDTKWFETLLIDAFTQHDKKKSLL
tara:strand:+ start:75 stop:470 length:396 start_codon:yes stop_codon:yes gene_type:complete